MDKHHHDIVVIGSSMGGVDVLKTLVAQLPSSFDAAIFIVQHVWPHAPGYLDKILTQHGHLPARKATDGEPIQTGTIYVAPPDYHLLVKKGSVSLSRGPRENRTRPAIDPLFRSAAAAYTSRVIGLVLSGYLTDGTAGLNDIKRCGGVALVLDPAEAVPPEMPLNALRKVKIDHVLPLDGMGEKLVQLVGEPAGPEKSVPMDILLELKITEEAMSRIEDINMIGEQVPLACPECGGPLWKMKKDGAQNNYRCHVGHGFSPENLLADQNEAIERALWAGLRNLEERANLLSTMANDEKEAGRDWSATTFEERAKESQDHADNLRKLILGSAMQAYSPQESIESIVQHEQEKFVAGATNLPDQKN